jgi:hypothetical protein
MKWKPPVVMACQRLTHPEKSACSNRGEANLCPVDNQNIMETKIKKYPIQKNPTPQ